jgi:hypothetical protein
MSQTGPSETFAAELARVTTAARGVLRRKLNVTLRPEDGRPENQDALELLGDINLRLLQKLQSQAIRPDSREIQNLDFYAQQAARNACAEYLRGRFPLRALLKNRLRRFFRSQISYAEWELDGELVCGFAGWRNRPEYKPRTEKINAALADPSKLAPQAWPRKNFDQFHLSDWELVIEPMLDALGCAIELDDLVSILAPRLAVKDVLPITGTPSAEEDDPLETATSLESLARQANPDAEIFLRELLGRLWRSLLQMDLRKRCAFLLNPPAMEVELLPAYGIAGIREIALALDLSDAQLSTLFAALPLDEAALAFVQTAPDNIARFAALWNHLPLQDALIAKVLRLTPQQVINQRMLARRILSRELSGLLSRRGNKP